MRRATAWLVVVGVVGAWGGMPSHARAEGFWVTLAAGAAGNSSPSDYSEFWFDTPHAPIVVSQVTGAADVQASTAGGSTFFNGAGTPVTLPTTDGYAIVTNRDVPNGSGGLPRFAGGTQASGAPQTGTPPADANLLSLSQGDKTANGSRVMSVGVTDSASHNIGQGQVSIPDGGWWVVGLGPGAKDTNPNPDPGPIDGGGGTGGGGSGGSGGDPGSSGGNGGGGSGGDPSPPPSTSGGSGGSVTTPEPATVVLLGLGGLTAAGWRRARNR
jgi:hypothetical protein